MTFRLGTCGSPPTPTQARTVADALGADDARAPSLVAAIDHPDAHRCVAAERALLAAPGADLLARAPPPIRRLFAA